MSYQYESLKTSIFKDCSPKWRWSGNYIRMELSYEDRNTCS